MYYKSHLGKGHSYLGESIWVHAWRETIRRLKSYFLYYDLLGVTAILGLVRWLISNIIHAAYVF